MQFKLRNALKYAARGGLVRLEQEVQRAVGRIEGGASFQLDGADHAHAAPGAPAVRRGVLAADRTLDRVGILDATSGPQLVDQL